MFILRRWTQRIFGFIHLVWMLPVPPELLLPGLCVDHIDFSLFLRYWANMSASSTTWCQVWRRHVLRRIWSHVYLCVLITEALFVLNSSGWWKHTMSRLHRWPSPRGPSSRASCWAPSMRRPIWTTSSWSPGMTPTETTPSTCRRATGWAASGPSGTPDTTGERGQRLGPGGGDPGLISFELHMSSGSNKGTRLDSLEAASFTRRVQISFSLNVNIQIWSSACWKPGNVFFTWKLCSHQSKSIWISPLLVGAHH